jgi:predicted TIM-barrel fold metal-dependent hydrolase
MTWRTRWIVALGAVAALLATLYLLFAPCCARPLAASQPWRADHHVHLASVDLCRRVGECLETNTPSAVYAVDAVRALDEGNVTRGVVLSCAYLYGLRSLRLSPEDIAIFTRRENEFTAAEVRKYPDRLVGFLSVDPLQPSAIAEIEHWRGDPVLRGVKLHLTASGVDLSNPEHRERLKRVLATANAEQLPVAIHVGGGDFGAAGAELFVDSILPSAGASWVQVAHAAGGLPLKEDNHAAVLRVFADHIAAEDQSTRHLLFDLSYVPAPEEDSAAVGRLVHEIRRIGIDRFLFGSDYNVLKPVQAAAFLERLGLTPDELQRIRDNCAPWAC